MDRGALRPIQTKVAPRATLALYRAGVFVLSDEIYCEKCSRFVVRVFMLPDYLAPNLEIVFIGLNPGSYSDKMGHYFARSTNLFWSALYEAGLVTERLKPQDDVRMNDFGMGLTDLVPRVTPNIDSLTRDEFLAGGAILRARMEQFAPRVACFVGITGFRAAFNPRALFGAQSSPVWGNTKLFIVPSTSPRNAYYRPQVVEWFKKLKNYHDSLKQEQQP